MESFELVFYRREDGSRPMDEFLDALEPKLRAKANHELRVLRDKAYTLREPYSKAMGGGLFELRVRHAGNIARVFYFFFDGRRIVVTNGFVKKQQKTPRKELERALAYKKDWEGRFEHGRP